MRCLVILLIWGIFEKANGVSTKLDFGNEEAYITSNTTQNDDVEVKHTIVLSTKLKNNNRRGIHSNGGDASTFTYNIGRAIKKEDSEEVPILNGYKALETTQIRTPVTRNQAQTHPDSFLISRNIRDDYDTYPNIATNPFQWKPSNFFNNVNWYSDNQRDFKPVKLHRKVTDDGMKEFYCQKCRELSKSRGCYQQRSKVVTSTTPILKLDGKLAKLD